MKDVIRYKGYLGSVHFDAEDEVFHGKIEGIQDLVTFEGQSVAELKNAFQEAVEDYLALCKPLPSGIWIRRLPFLAWGIISIPIFTVTIYCKHF
jgi:hypothetical protein